MAPSYINNVELQFFRDKYWFIKRCLGTDYDYLKFVSWGLNKGTFFLHDVVEMFERTLHKVDSEEKVAISSHVEELLLDVTTALTMLDAPHRRYFVENMLGLLTCKEDRIWLLHDYWLRYVDKT